MASLRALVALQLLAPLLLFALTCSPAEARRSVVSLPQLGKIVGAECTPGVSAFLGIPYAQPPTGKLRWKSPLPHTKRFPKAGLDATTVSAWCPQTLSGPNNLVSPIDAWAQGSGHEEAARSAM